MYEKSIQPEVDIVFAKMSKQFLQENLEKEAMKEIYGDNKKKREIKDILKELVDF